MYVSVKKLSAFLVQSFAFTAIFAFTAAAFAQSGPSTLNISGGLFQSNGTPVTSSSVTFRLEVYDPSGTCLLYSETHNSQDLSNTRGGFSLELGRGGSPTNLIDAGSPAALSWKVFQNTGAPVGPWAGCPAPVTMNAGDERVIRVSYDLGSGYVAMTPDVPIASSAYAMVAETLQGKKPTDFIQVKDDGATVSLSQSNIENIFSFTNYPKLDALVNGTSNQYMVSNPSAAVGFNNQRITNVGTPSAAGDAATKGYADGYMGGKAIDLQDVAAGTGGGKVLMWDSAQNKWVAQTPAGDSTKLPLAGGTMSGAIDMNGNNILNAGDVKMSAQKTLYLGTFDNAQEGVLVGTLDGTKKGATWYNSQTNELKVWNGTSAIVQAYLTSGKISASWLPDAIGAGAGSYGSATQVPTFTVGADGRITAASNVTISGVTPGGSAGGDLSGTYPNPSIKADAVTTAKILDGEVKTADLADAGVTPVKLVSGVNVVNRMFLSDGITGSTFVEKICAQDEVLKYNVVGGWACETVTNLSPVKQVEGRTGNVDIDLADIQSAGTAAARNVGTGVGDVVTVQAGGKLPAIDGSDLTNVNAVKLQGRDVANTAPNDTEVLMWDNTASKWKPAAIPSAPVYTSSNVGTAGVGVYKQKTGTNFEFKNVNAGSNKITVTDDTAANEIDIDINEGNLNLGNFGGTLPLNKGGTNANITAANGGVVYSTATAMAVTAAGSAGQMLRSNGAAAPAWSTATYPNSTTANQLLYSSANDTVSGLASANNSVLMTDGTGVPAWSAISGDNFTQYALLAGRAGGQNLRGGTAASENLTLESTSNATKGNVLINPNGGNVGIGTTTPGRVLDVNGIMRLEPAAVAGGAAGDIIIDSGSANTLKFHNGTSWVTVATSSTAGESNTASNQGVGGVGLYLTKSGVDLQFKNINAGSNKITVTNDGPNKEVDIDVDQTKIDHDQLLNYVANKHVDHSSVSIATAAGTSGLGGGGDLTSTRTLVVDITGTSALGAAADNADEVMIYDTSASALKKVTRAQLNLSEAEVDAMVGNNGYAADTNVLKKDGSVQLTADWDVGAKKVTNLAAPAASGDAATKGYADGKIGGSTLDLTGLADGQVIKWDNTASKWVPYSIPAAGESNTASNIGSAGVGVYKQKTGVNLEFKKVNAASNKVVITDDTVNNKIDFDIDQTKIDHDQLLNFVANEHVDHSSVSVATAAGTSGLSGGGDLTSTRNLVVDITGTGALGAAADNADEIMIYDTSASALKKVTRSQLNLSEAEVDAMVGNNGYAADNAVLKKDGSVAMTGNFKLGGQWLSNDGGNEGLWVSTTGDVGVGTSSPGRPLHVNGIMRLEPSAVAGGSAGDIIIDSGSSNGLRFHNGTSWVTVATSATAGESNTASNQGAGGVSLVLPKSGVDLPFKSINAGSNKITVANDAVNKEVDIDVDQTKIDHDQLLNYVANKHVDHSSVSIATAAGTSGLSGGGDITSTRNLVVDITGTGALGAAADNADEIMIYDTSASALKKVTRSQLNLSEAEVDAMVGNNGYAADTNVLKKDGSVQLTADWDVGAKKLTNLAAPAASGDAATKGYADGKIGGSTLDLTGLADGQVIKWDNTASKWVPYSIPSAGESNTASNQGAGGVGLYITKSGVDLQFKNINAGSNKITVTNDGPNKEVDIDIDQTKIDHDQLLNFVANEHVDHSSVSVATAAGTSGLSGGGDLTSTRNLVVDITGTSALGAAADNADEILIYDASATALKKVTRSQLNLSETEVDAMVANNGYGDFMKDGSIAMTGSLKMGGNTVYGNSTANGNLTLESTSNATKGFVILQPNGGNVGIGTTNPSHRLHVVGSGNGTNVIAATSSTTSSSGNFRQDSSGEMTINLLDTAGTGVVKINSSGNSYLNGGNIGIGTTSPGRLLHVNGPMRVQPAALPGTPAAGDIAIDSGAANTLKFHNGTSWVTVGSGSGDFLKDGSVAMTGNFRSGGKWISNDGGDEGVWVGTDGKVGIGTSGPSALFSVGGANTDKAYFFYDNANVGDTTDGQALYVYRRAAEGDASIRMYVDQYRQGTVKSDGNLILQATEASTGVYLQAQDVFADPTNKFAVNTAGSERMRIDSSGKVGIGTTSPGQLLHVGGAMRLQPAALPGTPGAGDIAIDSAASNTLKYYNGSGWVSVVSTANAFVNDGNSFGAAATIGTNDSNTFAIETAGTTRMTFQTDGRINTTQNVTTANSIGQYHTFVYTPPVNIGMSSTEGAQFYASRAGASNVSGRFSAVHAQAVSVASGTNSDLQGVWSSIQTSGTGLTDNGYGVYSDVNAQTGTITNAYGFYGTITNNVTNAYGVYIGPLAATGSKYGVYQSDATALNYFAGSLGVGTTSPARSLHVNGPMRVQPAALPGTPGAGDIAIDSGAANALKFHNGTSWVTVGTGNGNGDFMKDGSVAMTGNIRLNGNWLSGDGGNEGIQVDSSGRVGVGTAPNSSTQFHVKASSGQTIARIEQSANSPVTSLPTLSTSGLEMLQGGDYPLNGYGTGIKFVALDGDFGGTPKYLAGIFPRSTEAYSNNTASGMALDFMTTPNASGATPTPAIAMTINHNANVGIGTTNPGRLLHVNGPMRVEPAALPTGAAGDIVIDSGANNALKFHNGTSWVAVGGGTASVAGSTDGVIQFKSGTNLAANNNLFWDNTNSRLGIGTTAPSDKLRIEFTDTTGNLGGLVVYNTSNGASAWSGMTIKNDGGTTGYVWTPSSGYSTTNLRSRLILNSDVNNSTGVDVIAQGATSDFRVYTGGNAAANERVRVNSSGNVGIGTTSPGNIVTIAANGEPAVEIDSFDNNGNLNPVFWGKRARGTVGAPANVAASDALFELVGSGYAAGAYRNAAYINMFVDGTPGAGDMPGRIELSTSLDGTEAPAPRMTIKNSGNIGIGTTNPGQLLHVNGAMRLEPAALPTGAAGDIAIDSGASNALKFHNGSSWVTVGTGSGTPAGSNTQIQFNNSNAFGANSLFVFDNTNTRIGIGNSSPSYRIDASVSGAAVQDVLRLQNTVAAANGSGAQMLFAANRTTGGLTNVAGVSGLITDITNGAYKGALAFSTANNGAPAERVRIDESGFVGIGTSTPGALLDVQGSSAPARLLTNWSGNSIGGGLLIDVANSAAVGGNGLGTGMTIRGESSTTAGRDMVSINGVWTDATDATRTSNLVMNVVSAGGSLTERVRVTPNSLRLAPAALPGSPAAGDIAIDSGASNTLKFHNGSAWVTVGSGGASVAGSTDGVIQFKSGTNLAANNNLFWDNTNSRLGVGTTAPASPVEIKSTGNAGETMKIANTNTGNGAAAETAYYNDAGWSAYFGIGGTGLTDVRYSNRSFAHGYGNGLSLVADSSSGTPDIRIYTGVTPASEKMRIETSGNVGIGTTAPGARLHAVNTSTTGNSSLEVLRLSHEDSDSAGATGIGAKMVFTAESTASGVMPEAGVIEAVLDDATDTSKDSSLRFYTLAPNSAAGTNTGAERLRVTGNGIRVAPAALPGTAAAGDIVFDSGASNALKFHNGTAWVTVGSGGAPAADSLDFTEFKDAMALDASTDIAVGANVLSVTNDGSGYSFVVNDNTSSDTTPFVIDGSGNIGVGTSSPVAKFHMYMADAAQGIFISNTSATAARKPYVTINNYDGTGFGGYPKLELSNSRGSSLSPVVAANNDVLGALEFNGGSDGIGTNKTGASIKALAQGTFSNTNAPGALVFSTTLATQSTPTERMRIDNAGNVGIGTTSPGQLLHVNGAMRLAPAALPGTPAAGDMVIDSGANNTLKFHNGSSWVTVGSGGTPAGSNTQIQFNNSNAFGANSLFVFDNTNTRIGIGNSSPSYRVDASVSGAGVQDVLRLQNTVAAANGSGAQMLFAANRTTGGLTNVAGVSGIITDITNSPYKGALVFSTANNGAPAERMRIDENGFVGIGRTTPTNALDIAGGISAMYGATFKGYGATFPTLGMAHARNTEATPQAVASGDVVGQVSGTGYDGSQYRQVGAIKFAVDGISGANDMPGRIEFYTTVDGAGLWAEKMRLTNAGNLGIGLTNPAQLLHVNGPMRLQPAALPAGAAGDIAIDSGASNTLKFHNGTSWVTVGSGGAPAADSLDFTEFKDAMALDADTTLNLANFSWTQDFTGTAGTGFTYNANSLTSGVAYQLNSTSTAGAGGNDSYLFKVNRSGANTNASHRAIGIFSAVTNTGTTSTNVAGWFQASGATNNYAILVPSGNVGIGTTAPGQLLHVNGAMRLQPAALPTGAAGDIAIDSGASNALKFHNGSSWVTVGTGTASVAGTTDGVIQFKSGTNLAANTSLFWDNTNKYLGIGTTAPAAAIEVRSETGEDDIKVTSNNASSVPSLLFNRTRGTIASPTTVSANDVLGEVIFRGLDTAPGGYTSAAKIQGIAEQAFTSTASTQDGALTFSTALDGTSGERMRVTSAGYVGIGTTNPSGHLHIKGSTTGYLLVEAPTSSAAMYLDRAAGQFASLNFRSAGSGRWDMRVTNEAEGGSDAGSNFQIYKYTDGGVGNGAALTILRASGNVGIGTTGPGEKLEVNGNVKATAFISTSDRRLKMNIRPVEGIEALMKLNGVRYEWKANGQTEMGVIAQEVEEVFPEAVVTDPNTGMKAVKYNALISPLIESTKEVYGMCKSNSEAIANTIRELASVKAEVQQLREENAELKSQLNDMNKRMEALDALIKSR